MHTILPGHTYLYTWDNPLGKKGLLCWITGPDGKEMRKFTVKPQVSDTPCVSCADWERHNQCY